MSSPGCSPATDGYDRDTPVTPLPQDLTLFPLLPENPASFNEQPMAAGGQDINALDWAYSLLAQELVYTLGVASAASFFANIAQYPTLGPHPPYSLVVPSDPSYDATAAETIPDRPEADFDFILPNHAKQLPPPFHPHYATHDHTGNSVITHNYPPSSGMYYDQTEGHLIDSSAAPNRDHGFSYAMVPTVGPHLLPDDITGASPILARETDRSGVIDLSVSGPPGEMGNKETTGLPKGSPPPGTNNSGSQKSKERKRPNVRDEPCARKRARQSRPDHPDPERRLIQPTPSSLPRLTRPDLRIVRQAVYKCGNTQKNWTKLPDIVFRVGGMDGMKLTDAVNPYFNGPDGRDELMFVNGNIGISFSCRIIFEGYQTCGGAKSISTSNFKKEKDRVTKKKLADYTAKRIKSYLEELKGAGTPFHIPFENMFLTRIVHVSKGSFQPEIWYQITPSSSSST